MLRVINKRNSIPLLRMCWETYRALRNTTCFTLNIVMETLTACIFKE